MREDEKGGRMERGRGEEEKRKEGGKERGGERVEKEMYKLINASNKVQPYYNP